MADPVLTPSELALFGVLCRTPVAPSERLAEAIGHDLAADPVRVNGALRQHVHQMRPKLHAAGYCVHAVRGLGYTMRKVGT